MRNTVRKKPLILVVDDNPVNLRILVDNLQEKYALVVAKTGEKALEHAVVQRPDLILLDIVLPDMDGFAVCEELQQQEATRSIPVIFISSMQDPEYKTRAFSVGGVDYVTKPFHQAEVVARVHTHLLLKGMRERLEEKNVLVKQELSENRRQLNTLMDNLPGIAYRSDVDTSRTMQFMSVGTHEITGFPHTHFTEDGMEPFISVVAEEDRAELTERLQAALAARLRFEHVYRIQPKSGDARWVREQAVGLYDDDGSPFAIEGFISDVTESKMQELGICEENRQLKSKMKAHYFGNIVGNSEPMQNIYEMILKAGATDDNVIVYGESGTGKELVSRAVHDNSSRFNRNYVPVNCGAIPEQLFESEFFGHKKGAFTGAVGSRKGYLEQADNGTLFLDELGEISLIGQIKLLRAIEGGGFTPVGGTELVHTRPRIVAATNRDLMELVQQGQMRSDFYYRIHVVPIYIPPLRDRKEDIPLLIDHFLRVLPDLDGRPQITTEVLNAFMTYDWPGNIREMQNALHQYLNLGTLSLGGERIITGSSSVGMQVLQEPLDTAMSRFERQYIMDILKANEWHRSHTARTLQVDRRTLFRKMKQHRIDQT